MQKLLALVLCAAVVGSVAAQKPPPPIYSLARIELPKGDPGEFIYVSRNGSFYTIQDSVTDDYYLYRAGQKDPVIDLSAAFPGYAFGPVNDKAVVVISKGNNFYFYNPDFGTVTPYRGLTDPSYSFYYPVVLNDRGNVAGREAAQGYERATRWSSTTNKVIWPGSVGETVSYAPTDLTNDDYEVGIGQPGFGHPNSYVWVYSGGTPTILSIPGAGVTPYAISDNHVVAGEADFGAGTQGFLWSGRAVKYLTSEYAGDATMANGVDAAGRSFGNGLHGFLFWDAAQHPYDLDLEIVPPNDLNAKIIGWQYMAQNGQIFGYCFDSNYKIFPLILTPAASG